MIDDETKNKLIEELGKTGNIYFSCLKIGINDSTFYRWSSDKEFKKRANKAIRNGRKNISDIARQSLLLLIKDKNLGAVTYALSHLDPPFKIKKMSNVVILHKKDILPSAPQITLDDLLDDHVTKNILKSGIRKKL